MSFCHPYTHAIFCLFMYVHTYTATYLMTMKSVFPTILSCFNTHNYVRTYACTHTMEISTLLILCSIQGCMYVCKNHENTMKF